MTMRTSTLLGAACLLVGTASGRHRKRQARQHPSIGLPYGDAATTSSWVFDELYSDEFLTGSAISANKWERSMEGWMGTVPGFFEEENAHIDGDGTLALNTKFESGRRPSTSTNNTCPCGFKDVTTPLLISKKKTKYGYFEVRAKFADANLLTSFWLQGYTGEINIFEIEGSNNMRTNYHCFDRQLTSDYSSVDFYDAIVKTPNFDPTTFHYYGLEWNEEGIKYFVDGSKIRSVKAEDGCFDQPMAIILSVETTRDTPQSFDAYTSNVDYVRRWTSSGAPAIDTTSGVTSTLDNDGAPTVAVCGNGGHVQVMPDGICPAGTHAHITTAEDCGNAAAEIRKESTAYAIADNMMALTRSAKQWPKGCSYHLDSGKLFFNEVGKDTTKKNRPSLCCNLGVAVVPKSAVCSDGQHVQLMENGICPCETHEYIASAKDCGVAASEVAAVEGNINALTRTKAGWPQGCSYHTETQKLIYNLGGHDRTATGRPSLCCTVANTSCTTAGSNANDVGPAPLTFASTSVCGKGKRVTLMNNGICPAGTSHIKTVKDCGKAAKELGDRVDLDGNKALSRTANNWPKACSYQPSTGKLFFNTGGKNVQNKKKVSLCCSDVAAPVCGDGQSVELMTKGTCPSGTHTHIATAEDCENAAAELGSDLISSTKALAREASTLPKGCTFQASKGKLLFNTLGKDFATSLRASLCCTASVNPRGSTAAVEDGVSRAVTSTALEEQAAAQANPASVVGLGFLIGMVAAGFALAAYKYPPAYARRKQLVGQLPDNEREPLMMIRETTLI